MFQKCTDPSCMPEARMRPSRLQLAVRQAPAQGNSRGLQIGLDPVHPRAAIAERGELVPFRPPGQRRDHARPRRPYAFGLPSASKMCSARPVATASHRPLPEKASCSLHCDALWIGFAALPRASHNRTSPSCPELANCWEPGRQATASAPPACSARARAAPCVVSSHSTAPWPAAITSALVGGPARVDGVVSELEARLPLQPESLRAHATQDSKPASSSLRSRSRPINTSRLRRSRRPKGRSSWPSKTMCTP